VLCYISYVSIITVTHLVCQVVFLRCNVHNKESRSRNFSKILYVKTMEPFMLMESSHLKSADAIQH